MELNKRKIAFINLGRNLREFLDEENRNTRDEFLQKVRQNNAWFTEENTAYAISSWGKSLCTENIERWLDGYLFENSSPTKVGIIMAGNIPLVGLHDLLSVLISGNIAVCKFSSKDSVLMNFIVQQLLQIEEGFTEKIVISTSLKNVEAVIATGSNNSSRYFEYYFSKVPHIFRKNRTSIAVLDGNETEEELAYLGNDIFQYFGLGCRNVTKLYLPENYDFESLFQAIYSQNKIIEHNKYANNYDYNKSIYLLNKEKLLENGFLMLKEDEALFSPVAVLFYEYYKNEKDLKQKISKQKENIQCIVSNFPVFENAVAFGKAQEPELWDYADGVDTLRFLEQFN